MTYSTELVSLDSKHIPSYVSEESARRALEKEFGAPELCKLRFNVMMARNSAGRVVPVIYNMHKDDFPFLIHSKFLKVN